MITSLAVETVDAFFNSTGTGQRRGRVRLRVTAFRSRTMQRHQAWF